MSLLRVGPNASRPTTIVSRLRFRKSAGSESPHLAADGRSMRHKGTSTNDARP